MIINHNITALNTYRQLNINSQKQASSMAKLSSGLRINSAADDAAGLSISEKMKGQIRGLDQASRNAQDGISMISTAEGALSETQDILQRMRELSVQASNGTNTDQDREAIQKETNQLTSEINRIGNTTQFNTKNLLKGTDKPATTTAAQNNALIQGQTGVAAGAISNLAINAKSVVAEASTTYVQGNTADATGEVGTTAQTTASAKGQKGVASLTNGLTFETKNTTNSLNDKLIKITQVDGSGGAVSSSIDTSSDPNVIEFKIGTDGTGKSLFQGDTRGELTNFLKGITGYSGLSVTLDDPVGVATAEPLVGFQDKSAVATAETYSTGTISGGKTETRGVDTFTITDAFKEAGDTVTVGGQTFTAVQSGADASKGEFNIDAIHGYVVGTGVASPADMSGFAGSGTPDNVAITVNGGTTYNVDQAALNSFGATGTTDDLISLLNNAVDGGGNTLSSVADVSIGSDGKIQIISKTADASSNVSIAVTGDEASSIETVFGFGATQTGTAGATTGATADDQARSLRVALDSSNLSTRFTASGSTTSGEIVLKENAGQATGAALDKVTVAGGGVNDRLDITNTSGQNLKEITISQNGSDALSVSSNSDGSLTIALANTSAYKNTAEEIQKAVQNLGTQNGVDYTKYEFKAEGNWDTNATGDNIAKATGTLVGGTQEVKGDYSFNIDKAFEAGDVVNIAGQSFKAVESDAISSKGEFNISNGSTALQAASLRDAISLNSNLKTQYNVGGTDNEIKLTEIKADGKDLSQTDLAVKATGTAGQYAVSADQLIKSGGSFSIDGENITVSDKETNVGYDNGTAIKEGATLADQTSALADAINKNANLSSKYTASVDDNNQLVLTQKVGDSNAPEVSMTTSTKGNFEASFQIGANAGQSMTIDIKDMRSGALGIAGDGSTSTVKASDGKVASYVSVANVTDGTNNDNKEFSLDLSTSDKASAAISVLDDAINAVSGQRSALGAYENRLDHTINNLNTSSQNITDASSRITDVDMAKEMMEQTKSSVLAQAAQAMLAQANQQPQQILQLLR